MAIPIYKALLFFLISCCSVEWCECTFMTHCHFILHKALSVENILSNFQLSSINLDYCSLMEKIDTFCACGWLSVTWLLIIMHYCALCCIQCMCIYIPGAYLSCEEGKKHAAPHAAYCIHYQNPIISYILELTV